MVFAEGVNLVFLQLGMLFGGGKDHGFAVVVDRFGDFHALFMRVPEELAEHLFDVGERMVVAIPKEDVVLWDAVFLLLRSLLLGGSHDGGAAIVKVRFVRISKQNRLSSVFGSDW